MGRRFLLVYTVGCELGVSDLWPGGDAPPDPTPADVEALIEQHGGWRTVLRTWDLDVGAEHHVEEVTAARDQSERT